MEREKANIKEVGKSKKKADTKKWEELRKVRKKENTKKNRKERSNIGKI